MVAVAAGLGRQSDAPYRQVVRADRAGRTRASVVEAAARRFEADGYAGTTVRAIAATAGVSVETVTGIGRKRDLLFAALKTRFIGAESGFMLDALGLPAPGTGAADATGDEGSTPEEIVARLVEPLTAAFARSVDIWRAFTAAANVDADVAAVRAEALAARRRDLLAILDVLATAGQRLPPDRDRPVDAVGLLTSHDVYDHLVSVCGWPPATYRSWVVGAILAELDRAGR